MKRNRKRILIFAVILLLLLPGCQIGGTNIKISAPLSKRYVFQIGDMACSVKEARLYLANYQNIYGTAYTLNLWEHDFGDESLETYIKSLTLNELVTMVCMNQLAGEQEIFLTEEEISDIGKLAKTYYDSLSKEEKEYLEVTVTDLTEYYKHYGLAQKVYQSLTGKINDEVSDDEARVMDVMQIYVTDGSKAAEVITKLQGGEDFAGVANVYNELESIQAHICRDDLPQEAEEIAFRLDNNEISECIQVESGYYFIKCLNKYNKELTEANKVTIIEKREQEAFDDVYNSFISKLDSKINEAVWMNLRLQDGDTIATGNFFDIYKTNMK